MGSMIHLAVGRLEIDWGKNISFRDHSVLYQNSDLSKVPYYYVDENDISNPSDDIVIVTEYKDGLSKPLNEVIDRIKLLGYTDEICENEFNYLSKLNDFDENKFSYAQLKQCLVTVDVKNIHPDYGQGGEDFGKFFRREIFPKLNVSNFVEDAKYAEYYIGEGMENLSPYTILHLLSMNPSASNLNVDWAFNDVEENGWATRDYFIRPLSKSNKFLIVTEGSSDVAIIKKALKLLKPHIADFFDFVDMQNGYPFSGVGSLVNFTKGLIAISVQNNTVVLFDNDAEGLASYNKCRNLNLPSNMKVLKLPVLQDFENFKTIGPDGENTSDINGRAVAIECFLDLPEDSAVRWNNFNTHTSTYQGELLRKDDYKKDFLNQQEKLPNYNYNKLEAVLEMIINCCIDIKVASHTFPEISEF